jgi:hypothetical protein
MIEIWKDIRGRRIDLRAFLIGTLGHATPRVVVPKTVGVLLKAADGGELRPVAGG